MYLFGVSFRFIFDRPLFSSIFHRKLTYMKTLSKLKIYSLALLFTICGTANAQINKGSFLISGSVSYSNQTTKAEYPYYDNVTGVVTMREGTYKSTGFSFGPKVGYLFTRNLCAG